MQVESRTNGYNDRYAKGRFRGVAGCRGLNQFPAQEQQLIAVTGAAGTYDGASAIPQSSTSIQVVITVTTVFNNSPTIIVGLAGSTNLLVTLANAVDLTTLGVKTVVIEVTWPSSAVPRVTIGGTVSMPKRFRPHDSTTSLVDQPL